LGSHLMVNQPSITYYWIAMREHPGLHLGIYQGTGEVSAIHGVPFRPSLVIVMCQDEAKRAIWRMASHESSFNFSAGSPVTSAILTLDLDGFTVGSLSHVNETGANFHYIALQDQAGAINTGSYDGDGIKNREVDSVGFFPRYVVVRNASISNDPLQRFASMPKGYSINFRGISNDYGIQDFTSKGFTVGGNVYTNDKNVPYIYFAF